MSEVNKEFVHLHLHTEYSLLDGAAKIKEVVKEVKKQGATAVAMTDHGNMFGAIKFYHACKNAGIKPIIGLEFYCANDMYNKKSSKQSESEDDDSNPKYHLVLLAKNITGFKNIEQLTSISYVDGFYGKPRIDLKLLEKYTEGVICMSACIGGAIPRLLLNKNSLDPYADALNYAKRLKSMFAEGDFYIELQNHGLQEEAMVNPSLVKIAREIGVKCVATNDVHYVHKSDEKMHDVLLCIQTTRDYDDPTRMRFSGPEYYMKSYEEMEQVLGWCPEALQTTTEIAEKCNLEIKFHDYCIPVYGKEEGIVDRDYLRKLCYDGLKERYGEITPEIKERAEYELGIIIRMGFASYYLIVWDFIHYAKTHGIPVGAGRGSGVGSIVAYAIKITDVDPLEYGLIFERFLNPERVSMPDFDVDFCSDRRDEVIEYVRQKYGRDKVCQIITFGTMKSKNAIKDVARVFKLPFAEVNLLLKNVKITEKSVKISNLIDENSVYQVKELVELYKTNPIYQEVLDIAIQIEDMPKSRGKHAAGVIICSVPLLERVPLARNGEDITTQFDMTECESLGLLKMDFLALKTLTDIKMATDYIWKFKQIDVNFHKLGYEDPEVYDFIGSGDTQTVFQLESPGMQNFMKSLHPTLFSEIIAGISLYRPGPMDAIPAYTANKKNQDKIDYRHDNLKPILQDTYGIIVYQEQAMKITQALAGYTMPEADNFRKFISKKKVEDIPKHREKFVSGCMSRGVSETFARHLWDELEKFGAYAFNKSHAAAYAVLSYQTAFLKHYYPVEYMCSVINNRLGNPDDTSKYLRLIKTMNIELLQPDINHSYALFTPQEEKIRYGLACIKNVGKQAVDIVVDERNTNGLFKDFSDFARRVPQNALNKRMIESLIMGGAFDCFGHTRRTMLNNYEAILSQESINNELLDGGQMFFDFMLEEEYQYKELPESKKERLAYEKDVAGRYITGHPLDGKEDDFKQFKFNLGMLVPADTDAATDDDDGQISENEITYGVKSGTEVVFGGIISNIEIRLTKKDKKRWASGLIEDMYDNIEFTCFGGAYEKNSKYLVDDAIVKIRGRVLYNETSSPKIDIREIIPWDISSDEELISFDKRTLCLRLAEGDYDTLDEVENVLQTKKGENPVIVQMGGKAYKLDYCTGDLDGIKPLLVGLVGVNNIKIKD